MWVKKNLAKGVGLTWYARPKRHQIRSSEDRGVGQSSGVETGIDPCLCVVCGAVGVVGGGGSRFLAACQWGMHRFLSEILKNDLRFLNGTVS